MIPSSNEKLFPYIGSISINNLTVNEEELKVNDIYLEPLDTIIESSIEKALNEWNEIDPDELVDHTNYKEQAQLCREVLLIAYSKKNYLLNSLFFNHLPEHRKIDYIHKIDTIHTIFNHLPCYNKLLKERNLNENFLSSISFLQSNLRHLKKSFCHSTNNHYFVYAKKLLKRSIHEINKDIEITDSNKNFKRNKLNNNHHHPNSTNENTIENINNYLNNNEMLFYIKITNSKDIRLFQKLFMYGTEYLAELSDKISCFSYGNRNEMKSNFFFISNEFYIDKRNNNNIDYTFPIRQWINQTEERKDKYGNDHSINHINEIDLNYSNRNNNYNHNKVPKYIEKTKLIELKNIQFNKHYLYVHRGNCEHYIQFLDIRFLTEYDTKIKTNYPFQTRFCLTKRTKCMICDHYFATRICYGDKITIEDPIVYCEHCYFIAHYSPEGKLLYSDFKTFLL